MAQSVKGLARARRNRPGIPRGFFRQRADAIPIPIQNLTNSFHAEEFFFEKPTGSQSTKKFLEFCENPMVRYRVYKSPPLLLSQMNTVYSTNLFSEDPV